MPFFTGGPDVLSNVQAEGAAGQQSALGDSLAASFTAGLHETPMVRIGNFINHTLKSTENDTLSPEDANARYGIKGSLNFDKPISSKLANTLYHEKRDAILRDMTARNGPGGVVSSTLNMAAGALPSFLDPINYAATLVPGLGEERITASFAGAAARAGGWGMEGAANGLRGAAALNHSAGEALGASRAGRFVQGASQGVAGQAALEPLNLYLDRDEHTDWSMGQALSNLAFGGLMGGALHSLGRPKPRSVEQSADTPSTAETSDGTKPEEPRKLNTTLNRLNAISPNARGQILAESLVSLNTDRPSNAESLLHLNELEKTRHDLDRWVVAHRDRNADFPQQGRGSLVQDLTDLHQKHTDLLHEHAHLEPPLEEAELPASSTASTASTPSPRTQAEPSSPSLFTFLTKHGGVRDDGGDLKASDIHKQRIGLVRRKGGLSLDRARELAEEAGYLKPGAEINDLLHAMAEESHGRKSYADGIGPQNTPVEDPAYKDHARASARDDVEVAAYGHDKPLSEDVHARAAEATLHGADPHDALEDALKASSADDWERYQAHFDKSHSVQKARLTAQKDALRALTEHHLGRYGQHLDAGVTRDELSSLTDNLLHSATPENDIEHALNVLEARRGQGFDPQWNDTVHSAYHNALQKISTLQEGIGSDIVRALQGHESREIAESRAGLSAQTEAAPTPEKGTSFSPLPTRGIEHLNLEDVGPNPELVGHMMDGIEGVPAWPVVLGDKGKADKPYLKDGKQVHYVTGRLHILERHGPQLQAMGYDSPAEYIRHILKNVNEVRYDSKNDSYFLVVKGEKNSGKSKHDAAVIELKKEDGYYRVKTAAPFRFGYLKNKTLLQEERRTIPSDRNGHDHPLRIDKSHMPDGLNPAATVGAEEVSPTEIEKISGESQEGNKKLLWEKDLSTSSSPTGQGSASFYPRGQETSGTPRSERDKDRQSNNPEDYSPSPQSQEESFTQAQNYGAQLDQQIALHGDAAIPPDELEAIKREHALSDGNANALFSAMSCLIRNGK